MYFTDKLETIPLVSETFLNNGSARLIDAFNSGFESGSTWNVKFPGDKTTPGGPWVHNEQTQKENDAWLYGWKMGKAHG